MRLPPLLLAVLLLLPGAVAEFGEEDHHGWPVGEGGLRHHPDAAFEPAALEALHKRAWTELALAGEPLNRVGGNTLYPYYPILHAELQRLAGDHPDKVRLHSAGKSTAGLDLWMLEIADFERLDADAANRVPLADREVLWVDGGTHSNEYSGVYFVLAFAQWLLDGHDSNESARWIVENRHTWIMPMVNPDGSHVMGRLNANLVNVNRNYPVIWGGDGTDNVLNNPGPEPASEVETRIVIDWWNRTQPDYMASIHCCGNLWLFPYGEDQYDPPDVDMMNRICDEAFPGVRDDCGPIWSTIYPASGSSVDTAYEYTGAVSFGYEMSGRSNLAGPWGEPVTAEEVRVQERESWDGLVHAFLNVERYGAWPLVEYAKTIDGELRVGVKNAGYGNLTGAVLHLGDHAVPVPPLEPGQAALLSLPIPADGVHAVRVEYQKRIMADVQETTTVRLAVGAAGRAAVGGDPDVVRVLDLRADARDAATPAPVAGLFVALALAATALRRR